MNEELHHTTNDRIPRMGDLIALLRDNQDAQGRRIDQLQTDLSARIESIDKRTESLIEFIRGGTRPQEHGLATELAVMASRQAGTDGKLDRLITTVDQALQSMQRNTEQTNALVTEVREIRTDVTDLASRVRDLEDAQTEALERAKAASDAKAAKALTELEQVGAKRLEFASKAFDAVKPYLPWLVSAVIAAYTYLGSIVNKGGAHGP